MKRFLSIALMLAVLSVSGCAGTGQQRYHAQFYSLFDTVTTIVGFADSEADFKAFAEKIRGRLEEYHRLYDIYNDYEGVHNIKTINDNAGVAPVKADRRIIDMLLFARTLYEETGGTVNVAMGSVLSIWHDYREAGTDYPEDAVLPPAELLAEAARHMDMRDMVIDEAASTVYLRDPDMKLDVGAVAKGYAVEQLTRELEREGTHSLLLSVGGNVRAIGGKAAAGRDGDGRWTIGVDNPDKASEQTELFSLRIEGLSVVSSGISERYYTVDGVRYHHIIDPSTLMPADRFAQVTIVCRDSGLGDALSTAVFNMPLEQGQALVTGMEGVEACWVMKDGRLVYSAGFQSLIKTA